MRVLALTNLYPNPYQPLRASFNRQLFRALGEQVPLQVISPIAWTDELATRRKGGDLPRDRRVTLDGLTVDHPCYLYTPKVLRYWYGSFYRFSVRKTFERALDEFRPEIIFAPWAYPDGWAAVELGHFAGLPVVIKVHGSDIRVLSHYPGRRRRTAEALQRADGVIAVSKELSRQVANLNVAADKIHVSYGGVDLKRFCPGSPQEARVRLGLPEQGSILLFIGNLVPVKGLDSLVHSCSLLMRSGTEFTCYLIGHGPLRPILERQIERLQLGERVRLMGPRPHEQLPDWFRAASVFVLPSRSEGLPTVLLEALASGTPYVASRVGGIPELSHLGRCRLVRPDDPGKLAEAVRLTLAESEQSTGVAPVHEQLRTYEDEASELTTFLETVDRNYHNSRKPTIRKPFPRNGAESTVGNH
jgi:glycosyltransferase involved in cell wall biosynthesis